MNLNEKQLQQVEDYKKDIMSGRTFALHAMSSRSEIGYRPPINRQTWSYCMAVIAKMAAESDPLAQVAAAIIGKANLYGTPGQARAGIWDAAAHALNQGYTDVIKLASPEPGRRSDAERPYTLAERARVMVYLTEATYKWNSTAPGIGWCLAAVCEELGVRKEV